MLVGSYAHDEWESTLAPLLALQLDLPFVGVVRGVRPSADGSWSEPDAMVVVSAPQPGSLRTGELLLM